MANIKHLEMKCIEDVSDFLDEYNLRENRKIQIKLVFSWKRKSYINYDFRTRYVWVIWNLEELIEDAKKIISREYIKRCWNFDIYPKILLSVKS